MGPPIGVEPRSAIENSAMTRPRNCVLELSCSVAFDSEIVPTLAAACRRTGEHGIRGHEGRHRREGDTPGVRTWPATITKRRGVAAPDDATTRPPTTAPAPISDVITARPQLAPPAPKVNSANSGRAGRELVGQRADDHQHDERRSQRRRVPRIVESVAKSWRGARALRAEGWSSSVRISTRAITTAR